MADTPINVTAANVKAGDVAQTQLGIAGTTITAGQLVYKKTSDGRFYPTDVDVTAVAANPEIDNLFGVALNGASAGQPLTVIKSGEYYHGGAGVTAGAVYAASATAGGFCLASGLVSTDYLSILGYAKSSLIMVLSIAVSDVQVA
jgi:hypothetical protein